MGFIIFSWRGKKKVGKFCKIFVQQICLIHSVRATAKGRFDTGISVILRPLPETVVLLLLQLFFEIWNI